MGFTWRQGFGGDATQVSGVTTTTGVLANNPLSGSMLMSILSVSSSATGVTLADSNSNSFTKTPLSPWGTTFDPVFYLYYLMAPSNASKTITANWTGNSFAVLYVDEFMVSGGAASFQTPSRETESGGSGSTSIATPIISPTTTINVIYAGALPNAGMSAPVAGGTLSGWTGAAGGITTAGGITVEYRINAGPSTPVAFTQTDTGVYSAVAFWLDFTSAVQGQGACGQADYQWGGGYE